MLTVSLAGDVCPDKTFFKVPASLHELVQGIYYSREKIISTAL
jgi:hypothetical protein